MGQNMSLNLFETINTVLVTLGGGLLGVLVLLNNGLQLHLVKTIFLAGVTFASYRYVLLSQKFAKVSENKVIFITGCDSGLGFSLAKHSCDLGFTVFAGCLNLQSEGANKLNKCGKNVIVVEIDITKEESVNKAVKKVEEYLVGQPEKVLWALVNNAGVMVFGEFEWQTEKLIQHQINVNLFGTMRVTRAFLSQLRKYSGRIITISSHCANETLPGLSPYGATKAGLSAWNDGLRVELKKFGIKVTQLIPGSFVMQSNIMARLNENVLEMENAMTKEQFEVYGNYFRQYNSYLSALSGVKTPKKIDDIELYKKFEDSLLDMNPKKCYIHEPWRYTIYHTLFRFSPTFIRDFFVVQFVQMPEWDTGKRSKHIAETICMVEKQ